MNAEEERLFLEVKNLKKSIIDLVKECGFDECYNPLSGKGLGTDSFSWTASLPIERKK